MSGVMLLGGPDRQHGRRLDIEKRAYGWRGESRVSGIDKVDE
jgi:hypothetical protein